MWHNQSGESLLQYEILVERCFEMSRETWKSTWTHFLENTEGMSKPVGCGWNLVIFSTNGKSSAWISSTVDYLWKLEMCQVVSSHPVDNILTALVVAWNIKFRAIWFNHWCSETNVARFRKILIWILLNGFLVSDYMYNACGIVDVYRFTAVVISRHELSIGPFGAFCRLSSVRVNDISVSSWKKAPHVVFLGVTLFEALSKPQILTWLCFRFIK